MLVERKIGLLAAVFFIFLVSFCFVNAVYAFELIYVTSSIDGSSQPSYWHRAGEENKPLLVCLHSWSSDYNQAVNDAQMVYFREQAINNGWNFLFPNFRGPNNNPDACASELAIQDIIDAIQFAVGKGANANYIYIIGGSGGGHMACVQYMKNPFNIRMIQAWVPITDLTAWYRESKWRNSAYYQQIAAVCGGVYSEEEARSRSPFYMSRLNKFPTKLILLAGVQDGYTGAVPISHSMKFYEHVTKSGYYTVDKIEEFLGRGPGYDGFPQIQDRRVVELQEDSNKKVKLVLFDGTHEILHYYAWALCLSDYNSASLSATDVHKYLESDVSFDADFVDKKEK